QHRHDPHARVGGLLDARRQGHGAARPRAHARGAGQAVGDRAQGGHRRARRGERVRGRGRAARGGRPARGGGGRGARDGQVGEGREAETGASAEGPQALRGGRPRRHDAHRQPLRSQAIVPSFCYDFALVSDVIESATQLLMLAEERELAGKTMRNVVAPGCGLAGADLDSVSFERVSLERANLSDVRLEHASLRSVDLTGVDFEGALFHRVRAYDNTLLTEARMARCEIRRCELGPNLRMPKADLSRAKIQGTTFRQVELYGASFKNA